MPQGSVGGIEIESSRIGPVDIRLSGLGKSLGVVGPQPPSPPSAPFHRAPTPLPTTPPPRSSAPHRMVPPDGSAPVRRGLGGALAPGIRPEPRHTYGSRPGAAACGVGRPGQPPRQPSALESGVSSSESSPRPGERLCELMVAFTASTPGGTPETHRGWPLVAGELSGAFSSTASNLQCKHDPNKSHDD